VSQKISSERQGAVVRVWINRPEIHNAFDDEVIAQLGAAIEEATADADVRVIVLGGRGRSFSAGADLNWMRSAASTSDEENLEDAGRLASMLRTLGDTPKATVARVQGTALGGGLGLIAACDVAIAAKRARFGFSEVELGLIPAVISPHVVSKIGPGHARRLFVTGERFDAEYACRIGLIAQVVEDDEALDAAVEQTVGAILSNAPGAVGAAKELVREVTRLGVNEVDDYTARQIAARRGCEEGREGIAAFLEKRKPGWG